MAMSVPMDVFPLFFRMDSAHVVVFGAGEAALRKVRLLARTPARITLVSAASAPAWLAEFKGRVEFCRPADAAEALKGASFAIVALEDGAEALKAANLARAASVPVNAVDRKGLSDVLVPSIAQRGRIVAAIASGGAAPVLARRLRAELETLLAPELAEISELALALRAAVRIAFEDERARRRFWERFFAQLAETSLPSDPVAREALLRRLFAGEDDDVGEVSLVVAGKRAPDLISLRAYRRCQSCDLALHDAGLAPEMLDLIRRDADRAVLTPQAWREAADRIAAAWHAGDRVAVLVQDVEDADALAEALAAAGCDFERL